MKMSAKLAAVIVFVIAIVLLSVISFVLLEETDYFWVTYGFTLAAVSLLFGVILYYLSDKERSLKEFPANAPYAYMAIQYIVIEVVLAAAFGIIGGLMGLKIIYYICAELVLALIYGIRIVLAIGAKSAVIGLETKVAVKTQNWKLLASDVQAIQAKVGLLAPEIRTELSGLLNRLLEAVRFSDPMSIESFSVLESQISQDVSAIGLEVEKLKSGEVIDTNPVKSIINNVEKMIEDRNNRMKIYKE